MYVNVNLFPNELSKLRNIELIIINNIRRGGNFDFLLFRFVDLGTGWSGRIKHDYNDARVVCTQFKRFPPVK